LADRRQNRQQTGMPRAHQGSLDRYASVKPTDTHATNGVAIAREHRDGIGIPSFI